MLAIFFFCTIAVVLPHQGAYTYANSVTRAIRLSAATVTAVAADGELLTLPDTPRTLPAAGPRETIPAGRFESAFSSIEPNMTAAPKPSNSLNDEDIRFIQTTYYSCVTMGTYSHCGLHEPILDASGASPMASMKGRGGWAVVAACVAAGVLLWR